ncbi:MAG: thiamine phosphate synthase [Ktedonobacteraceae bacterium]
MTFFSEAPPPFVSAWKREELIPRLALHVLTAREWSRGRDTLSVATAVLEGGATAIQLRDKQASTRQLVEEGLVLRNLTREYGALLIVNDRIDVALAVAADGVHLGQDDDMPIHLARQLLGPERILGVSAGNSAEAAVAIAAGADYISVGAIYATHAKSDAGAPIGIHFLSQLAAYTSIPLIAIGGITAQNVAPLIQAGAIGVAVITAVVSADDISAATRVLLKAMQP